MQIQKVSLPFQSLKQRFLIFALNLNDAVFGSERKIRKVVQIGKLFRINLFIIEVLPLWCCIGTIRETVMVSVLLIGATFVFFSLNFHYDLPFLLSAARGSELRSFR